MIVVVALVGRAQAINPSSTKESLNTRSIPAPSYRIAETRVEAATRAGIGSHYGGLAGCPSVATGRQRATQNCANVFQKQLRVSDNPKSRQLINKPIRLFFSASRPQL